MDTAPRIAGTPIEPPPGFPVSWKEPQHAGLLWEHDAMHFPDQLKPIEEDTLAVLFGRGFLGAAAALEMPIVQLETARINTWQYQAMVPFMGPPEAMQERGEKAEANMRAAVAGLREAWEGEYLPQILERLDWWAGVDLGGLSDVELRTHLEETWDSLGRLWVIHFKTVFPTYVAMSEFDEMYRDLFPDEDAFGSYRLLQGQANKTVESGQALWRLSRKAMASAEVLEVLETEAAADAVTALEGSEAGRAFLGELRRYLDAYGERCEKWSLTTPSWLEDPAPVLKNLKDLVTRPDGEAPAVTTRQAAEEADRAIAEARERLEGYPAAAREGFEHLLAAALVAVVLSEDHGFYIDFRATYAVRQVLLEVGRRLAQAGTVDQRDDVFMLRYDELLEALAAHPASDLKPLVAERAAELDRWRDVAPPMQLGTMPPEQPPPNPVLRAMDKLFGTPVEQTGAANELHGAPGSSGSVRAVARVVRSLADAERLQPGEVLVAETTAPPWTPLFASAGAVVTDTGGILSHCAVVAREYGIPAVVGTGSATTAISDGDVVEVDGDAGIVRIG